MRLTIADELVARRAAVDANPTLAALGVHLRALVEPLLHGELYLPERKPLLSKDGGVCPADGARLVFDPLSPHTHHCPQCDAVLEGERHHRAWIWRYHLWLSERAIHLALLAVLTDESELGTRAVRILERYADLYARVPNRDNVLGPTHLFFSTYLESIWLTQIVMAALVLDSSTAAAPRAALEPVVEESARLIASFDEGFSNRQVWNTTAQLGAAVWLDRRSARGACVERLRDLLVGGVTADGLWYEGENYHLFALRGLLLGAELARWGGNDLYADADAGPPLGAMYEAPLDTLLPDLTLPARGDAPYGVSIRQPRFAELWELGWARTGRVRLERLLEELYRLPGNASDGAFAELAEQETNQPPVRLRRNQLGWKTLLWAQAEPPQVGGQWRAASEVLDDAGVVVLRTGADTYASVECGGAPGGHGHPDLLHLTLFHGRLLLADFGTGSYVSPSLFWYRSTLAHNAPGLVEVGQVSRDADCTAFEQRDGFAWCRVEARDLFGAGTSAARSVVIGAAYVLDAVEVTAPNDMLVELPVHLLNGTPALLPRSGERISTLEAPGPPTLWFADGPPLRFVVRRASGSGTWVQGFALRGEITELVAEGKAVLVRLRDGTTDRVTFRHHGVEIVRHGCPAVTLAGARQVPEATPVFAAPDVAPPSCRAARLDAVPDPADWERAVPGRMVLALGEPQYRGSEDAWGRRGPFEARLAPFVTADRLGVALRVIKPQPTFRPAGASDPALDNEGADIHSDGVQWYVGTDRWRGWVLVPQGGGQVNARPVGGTAAQADEVEAVWAPRDDGYAVVATVRRPAGAQVGMNVVVNEMYPERERRAGQLAWTGGGGWVYLRGDRESPRDTVVVEVA